MKHFIFWEELSEILPYIYTGPRVKYPLLLSDFNEMKFLDRSRFYHLFTNIYTPHLLLFTYSLTYLLTYLPPGKEYFLIS